jgi:hypothetical protein
MVLGAEPPAGAVTATSRVDIRSGGALLGWATPVLRSSGATFINEADAGIHPNARTLIVISSRKAPATYAFRVDTPAGSTPRLLSSGAVAIVGSFGQVLGSFDAPWALDARGRTLNTRFAIAERTPGGFTLIQSLDLHGATLPVIADPKFTWGWVTGTIYFDKAETRRARSYAGAAWALGAACAFIGSATFGAGCIAAGIEAGWIAVQAANAVGDGRCLKIKVPTFEPGTYRGGHCR